MKELEEDFFANIAKAIEKASDIANFQEEVPRDDKEKAKIDYIGHSTKDGFIVDKDKSEEVQKSVEEFEQQKISDIQDFIDKSLEDA